MTDPLDALPRTPLHPCPYLPGRHARERGFVADELEPAIYGELMDRGFRRSGPLFYAPDCPGCRACVPLRVPVAAFRPSRSQRRVLRRNADVAVVATTPELTPATWQLYRRYLRCQHPPGDTDETPASLQQGLFTSPVDTVELRYRIGDRTVAVSLLDVAPRAVSSVYHFFDPDCARRSLGVFSVLHEIAWTHARGVPHYHLGYWVEGAATMHYKADYRPHELLRDGVWRPVS
ncbi:MAG: arginyltransferase [Planctomycetes bacterium]|nr:arginyltransferase [Planctomycetota bacterium]